MGNKLGGSCIHSGSMNGRESLKTVVRTSDLRADVLREALVWILELSCVSTHCALIISLGEVAIRRSQKAILVAHREG